MAAISIDESQRIIKHEINNRLNTLSLGLGVLEDIMSPENSNVIHSMKMELRDLQELIEQLQRTRR